MDKFLYIVLSLISLSFRDIVKTNKIEYQLRSVYFDSANNVTQIKVKFVILNKTNKTIKTNSPLFTTHVSQSTKDTFLLNHSKEKKNSNLISFFILDSFGNKYFLFPAIVDCSQDFLQYHPVVYYEIPKGDSVKITLSVDFKYDSSLNRQNSTNCIIDGVFRTKPSVTNNKSKYYNWALDSNIRIYSEYRVNGHFDVDTIGVPFL